MAATAVYVRLAPIPIAEMRGGEGLPAFANISATTAAFTVSTPGLYCATCVGSTFGTVTLQQLGPDDSTWLGVTLQTGTATVTAGTVPGAAASFAANGSALVYLSAGQYRWAIA